MIETGWVREESINEWCYVYYLQKWFQEENDSLRCQMEAYKNEVDLIKADLKAEVSIRDDQIEAFKKTLQGMQQVSDICCCGLFCTFLQTKSQSVKVIFLRPCLTSILYAKFQRVLNLFTKHSHYNPREMKSYLRLNFSCIPFSFYSLSATVTFFCCKERSVYFLLCCLSMFLFSYGLICTKIAIQKLIDITFSTCSVCPSQLHGHLEH